MLMIHFSYMKKMLIIHILCNSIGKKKLHERSMISVSSNMEIFCKYGNVSINQKN